MKKSLIAAALMGACATSSALLAQAADPAVGGTVFAMAKVKTPQTVGTVAQATDAALMIRIGDRCVGLPRQNFTETDGRFQSPWTKDALNGTMDAGNAADFTCPDAAAATDDPAVGREVVALAEVEQKQTVGIVKQADASALRIQIGDRCIGLPRNSFTEIDGQFKSPWAKDALMSTMDQGNAEDFVCPA